jgi:hypothetical protein
VHAADAPSSRAEHCADGVEGHQIERKVNTSGRDPARRSAGQYARASVRRLRMRTLVGLGVLAVATAGFGRAFGLQSALFIGSELALLVAMFAISRVVLPLVERRDRGASGEEQVGALLDELGERGWRVIHDATFGHGNVDHILVGPPGVFTVETKSHPGPIRVAQLHGATINQARAQSAALLRATGVHAQPLLVYSRAWVDRPGARRRGVRVIPARTLIGFLEKRDAKMSAGEIEQARRCIAAALREHAQRTEAARERWQLTR